MINPKKFLTEFYEKMASYPGGSKAFIGARESEKDLEHWAISMVLIGLNKMTGTPWWIKESKEDPPDSIAVTYKIKNDSTIEEYVPVEVVSVPKYVKQQKWDKELPNEENIYNFLNDKKFKNKSYLSGTHLIIYFNIQLDNFSLKKLSELISKRNPNLSEIWHIGNIDPSADNFLIGKIYPDNNEVIL